MQPDPSIAHSWRLTPKQAAALQNELVSRVREVRLQRPAHIVCGIDVSVRRDRVRAAAVLLELDGLRVIETSTWEGDVTFPYVPGLLSFRELPALIPLLAQLGVTPDLIIVDGQGRAHPRRFGLACHLGIYFDVPAMGVAKTRLVGEHAEPGVERGDSTVLLHRGEEVGGVLRTRSRVKPVYVSVGHRITLPEAEELALRCTSRYRLPEPTRLAHRLSKHGQL